MTKFDSETDTRMNLLPSLQRCDTTDMEYCIYTVGSDQYGDKFCRIVFLIYSAIMNGSQGEGTGKDILGKEDDVKI